jgi:GDP-L-fucose synthase
VKILITGGDGFIAKSLSEGLGDDFSVVSANRHALDLINASKLSDYLKRKRFDIIIHTATYDAAPSFSIKDPAKVLEQNLRMFFNIARCHDDYGKLIYFGSGAEFNRDHWQPRMSEDYFDAYVPDDPYGLSKYIMCKHAERSNHIYNLRLFGVFGKYDDWRYRFIPNTCCQAVFDLPLTINQDTVFDFLFVDDLVEIVKWFIVHQPSRKVYNVCSGATHRFEDLAKVIIEISGKNLDIKIRQNGSGKEYSGDNSLLLQELTEFQFTPIRQSIESLYAWYQEHRHLIDKAQLVPDFVT